MSEPTVSSTAADDRLQPCPWCGRSRHLKAVFWCGVWGVECEPCDISGPSGPTKADAEKRWNARANGTSIDARLLNLAAELSDAAQDIRALAEHGDTEK